MRKPFDPRNSMIVFMDAQTNARMVAIARETGRKIEELAESAVSNDSELALLCDGVLAAIDGLALGAGIDLGGAVVATFNATSAKLGFPERLSLAPPLRPTGPEAVRSADRSGDPVPTGGQAKGGQT
ncbi:MAG: hypothetical protein HY834_09010 [Devosia nanyangense]|uniref:Uncharacterized protein n=1 Tax=Devosia nanyangense TaxID=1228055 RepID=A0A933NYA9_9HYPH|nr:hypothetical protein [Devosia nanyangense]